MSISRILETCFQKTVSLLNMTEAAVGLIKKKECFFCHTKELRTNLQSQHLISVSQPTSLINDDDKIY